MKKSFKLIAATIFASLSVGAAVGAVSLTSKNTLTPNEVLAYDENTEWYVTGEFNEWNKEDPKCHLTYTQMVGNNQQFDSDYAIFIRKDQKFNIVNPYEGGYNTMCPSLQGEASTTNFTHPSDTDYLVANSDLYVKFYFQTYLVGGAMNWCGLYSWIVSTEDSDNAKNACLESWSYDFIAKTNDICSDGGTEDNEAALKAIWDISYGAGGYFMASDLNGWTANDPDYELKKVAGTDSTYRLPYVYVDSTAEFKITDGTWDHSWPSDNWKITTCGCYTIEFDSSTQEISVRNIAVLSLEDGYNTLSSGAKSFFTAANENPTIADAYARYVLVIGKYSSLTNFASSTVTRTKDYILFDVQNNANATLIVVIASVITLTAVAGFFFFKKKRV